MTIILEKWHSPYWQLPLEEWVAKYRELHHKAGIEFEDDEAAKSHWTEHGWEKVIGF